MLFFFFFKQKTAYEMRISDWSSDVCSSDLTDRRYDDDHVGGRGGGELCLPEAASAHSESRRQPSCGNDLQLQRLRFERRHPDRRRPRLVARHELARLARRVRHCADCHQGRHRNSARCPKGDSRRRKRRPLNLRNKKRSEEHTSELQSLMRISYAVFCLKKTHT